MQLLLTSCQDEAWQTTDRAGAPAGHGLHASILTSELKNPGRHSVHVVLERLERSSLLPAAVHVQNRSSKHILSATDRARSPCLQGSGRSCFMTVSITLSPPH